nr:nucleotide-binding alpha-beta plait domain-containing protein [Tanacetum cinerariifolium]
IRNRYPLPRIDDLFDQLQGAMHFSKRVFSLNSGQVIPSIALLQNEEEEDDVSVEDNHGGIHSDQEINNCNNESDVEEVPETCFNVPEGQKGNPSKDPFGIYPLLNKDKNIREHKINEEESSLKHPPGFTPVGNLNEGHLDGVVQRRLMKRLRGMITRLCVLLVVKKTMDQLTKCQTQWVR